MTESPKPTPEELKNALAYFSGTEQYHRHSILFPMFFMTDGCKYLADNAGCYWLFDVIASHQTKKIRRYVPFQVWKLRKKPGTSIANIRCEDGNKRIYIRQHIEYTDFPLDEITIYVNWDTDTTCIACLPGEY